MDCKVTKDEVNAFYRSVFAGRGEPEEVVDLAPDYALVRRAVDDSNLRPGGYINGPTQMALADSAAYIAIFTRTGITPMALTSNLNINFLRPCIATAVLAEARLMKLGQALAVIEVAIKAEGSDKISSHAIVTYALPRDA